MPDAPLTRDRVLEVALAIVEAEGMDGLSMRSLASKLGVAVTSIYWHVGSKDDLIAALVDRIGDEVGRVDTSGRTPERRVLTTARSLRRNLVVHRDLVALAHEVGRHGLVFEPTRAVLNEAFENAGLRGARRRGAVEAVVGLVVGSVLTERAVDRSGQPPHTDIEGVFETSLQALVRGLL